jgi:H+-translocating NAD(P) transhydrogenase
MLLRSVYRRVASSPQSTSVLAQALRPRWKQSNAAAAKADAPTKTTTPKGIPYTALTIGIPKETYALEKRVAATPESVERLLSKNFKAVHIETGAGELSCFADAAYQKVGATIVTDAYKEADIILKVSIIVSSLLFWLLSSSRAHNKLHQHFFTAPSADARGSDQGG